MAVQSLHLPRDFENFAGGYWDWHIYVNGHGNLNSPAPREGGREGQDSYRVRAAGRGGGGGGFQRSTCSQWHPPPIIISNTKAKALYIYIYVP